MQLAASAFDSQFYELNVGRLVFEPGETDLDGALAAARRERFDVVFVRLAEGDPMCRVIEAAGHRPVDTLVTSTLVAHPPPIVHPAIPIEHHDTIADATDLAAIVSITIASIQTSHLHADPRLPRGRTDALYSAWVQNDVTGRAQRTLVARVGGELIGYLAVLATPATAVIDLVAVKPSWHGRGVGSALLASFIAWAIERGGTATVGTQADNLALRLYARCGFVPTAKHVTYHLWLHP